MEFSKTKALQPSYSEIYFGHFDCLSGLLPLVESSIYS